MNAQIVDFEAAVSATSTMAVRSAALLHMALLDEFVRLTRDAVEQEGEGFTRESLEEMMTALRAERDGYTAILDGAVLHSPTLIPAA